MMAEMNLAKRFLGAKFGVGEKIKDGVYAIPTTSSKGNAFMRLEMKGGEGAGSDNFKLFWDEALTLDWYAGPKPGKIAESKWVKAFRALEKAR
jgi:hypothetical protein